MPKVSALAALTGPNLAAGDLFVLDDISATASKKITADDLLQGAIQAANKLILDESDNEWIKFVTTSSAINEFTITNAAAGSNPIFSATGGDTNIGLALTPKGTGGLVLTGNGSSLFVAGRQGATSPGLQVDASTSTCVTGVKITPAASGAGVAIAAVGGGTDEVLIVDAKGAGTILLNGTATGNVKIGTNLQFATTKSLVDANGNEILKTASTVASAINELTLTNAAAGNPYLIAATGGDTDIGISVDGKGAGKIILNGTGTGNVRVATNLELTSAKSIVDASGNEILKSAATVASAINELTLTNAAAGNPYLIAATGGDTDIGVKLDGKGAGTITFNATGTGNVLVGTNLQHASAKAIVDANGNESIKFPSTVASAVNEFTISNAATTAAPTITATGNDTNISIDFVPKAIGIVRARCAIVDKVAQTAVTDTATITIAQLLTGCLDGTPTSGATYTLPTAALLVAGIPNARVGDSFEFLVNNKAATALTITLAEGAGGSPDGTLTVAQNVIRKFRIIVTNVTGSSEAYFLYGIG